MAEEDLTAEINDHSKFCEIRRHRESQASLHQFRCGPQELACTPAKRRNQDAARNRGVHPVSATLGRPRIHIPDEEIIQRLIDGHSFKEMAKYWDIDAKTLWQRLDRMKKATQSRSLYQLIALVAARKGITTVKQYPKPKSKPQGDNGYGSREHAILEAARKLESLRKPLKPEELLRMRKA